MGMFLNTKAPFESYRLMAADPYFIDKTALISELLPSLDMEKRFFCITRPRRFGKTVMANMVGAFFGKSSSGEDLFGTLQISNEEIYKDHLNAHNVVFIDFSRMPRDCSDYQEYIDRIQNGLNRDLAEAYPELGIRVDGAVWDAFQTVFEETGDRFLFVMDEWDAIFHKSFIKEEDKESYIEFLRDLLKGQVYAELVYMTGVLPIAKYSSGSALNMFVEYDMAVSERFGEYFGFLDRDVDDLYEIYLKKTRKPKITREDLSIWYDGYHTASGERVYNPRSIICALTDNQLRSYWTSSGPYDEIFYYVKNNVEDIREDLALMISGEHVEARMQEYAATATELNTKDQIYSAMVVYGLLTYDDETGEVFIPNRELMDKFNELLLSNDSLGYIHSLAKASERMLKATLTGDTGTMAEILKFAHDTESPILSYNSEIELSAVVNLVYLAARGKYRVEREEKAGEGFVDFIFYPERRGGDAMILELKIDSTPETVIQQIKKKNYASRFQGKLGEKGKYTGRILAVGISYDRKTKEHFCKVEMLEKCQSEI